MKRITQTHAAFRVTGKADESIRFFEGQAIDAIKWIGIQILETTMAKRFDICLGRSKEEVEFGVTRANKQGGGAESLDELLAGMMADLPDTSDQD